MAAIRLRALGGASVNVATLTLLSYSSAVLEGLTRDIDRRLAGLYVIINEGDDRLLGLVVIIVCLLDVVLSRNGGYDGDLISAALRVR